MTPPYRFLSRLLWLALLPLLFCGAGLVSAASPRGQLLRYVPDDTALCMLLEGMRERGNALALSPLVTKLSESPLGKNASGLEEVKKLLALEKQVERFTGLSPQKLREDVLGDLLILAYKPGPAGHPEQDQGLVLLQARDAKALARMVEHINELQKKNDGLKLEERTHRGITYVCRHEKGAPTFYALRDSVLIFSGQEAMLKRALDLDADIKPEAVAPIEQSLQRLGVAGSLLTLWVNPRAFDKDLDAKVEKAQGSEAAFLKNYRTYWKALDALALAIHLDADLTFSLAISGRPDQIPPAAQSFLGKLTEPSRLWQGLPEDTLLALAGRFDFKSLFDALAEFMPADTRVELATELQRILGTAFQGRNLGREVLPALGPDLGVIVLPPPREQKGFVPRVILALRIKPGEARIDQALLAGLDFVATSAVLWSRPLTLKRETLDRIDIRSLSGEKVFPAAFQPAYALARGHLILASSPEVLRALSALLSEEAATQPTTQVPLLRISFSAWRNMLEQRQDEIVKYLTSNGTTMADAKDQVEAWLTGLKYLDRLEIRHQPAPGRILLQISLRTTLPLK
jgi:hypothetical protein